MRTQNFVLLLLSIAMFLLVNTGFSQNTQREKSQSEVQDKSFSEQTIEIDNYQTKTMDLYINKNNDSYSAFFCNKECASCKQTTCPMYNQGKCKMSGVPFNLDLKLSYKEVQDELQATLIIFD
jgi:hypothetical protein